MKKIINLGIQDYVAELYKEGELSIREAAEILQLSFRQTLEMLEEKVGGNLTIPQRPQKRTSAEHHRILIPSKAQSYNKV